MEDEIKERDQLVAVIIADSFTRSFWPVTNDLPKVLIPLCNIPLIEYTIELVIRNHIKKIILFSSAFSQKVLEYIQSQKYRQVSIQFISRPNCISLGDVMRALDTKKLLRNDFLIIFGDTIGNANLKEAIEHHRTLREKQKEFILTVVFSELPVDSRLRTEDEQCVVVLEDSRILQYDAISKKKKIDFNSNVKFKETKEFEIRYDLVESGVLICSPEIMHYFSDEFDYHSLRDHLMRDILTSEIYTDKFAAYVLPKHYYLHRVHVPKSYDAVSVDVMNRWLYPICLDANLFPPSTPSTYTSTRNNLYKEDSVQISKSARIDTPAVIGTQSVIEDDAVISMSTIGRMCLVKSGSKISNSYIWNNVEIGKNCQISHAIICNGVSIGDNCVIKPGSIISIGVKINPNQTIEERSRISLYKFSNAEEGYIICNEPSELGYGFIFDARLESRLSGITNQTLISQSIGYDFSWEILYSDKSDDSDSEGSESEEQKIVHEKFISKESIKHIEFIEELKSLICEMIEKDEGSDSMQIEINSLKFSQNKDFLCCISGILQGIVESCVGKLAGHFEKCLDVLTRYVSNDAERMHLMRELESCLCGKALQGQFHLVVKVLYENEIVDGDCILEWYKASVCEPVKEVVSGM